MEIFGVGIFENLFAAKIEINCIQVEIYVSIVNVIAIYQ